MLGTTFDRADDPLLADAWAKKMLLLIEILGSVMRTSATLESPLVESAVMPLLMDIILDSTVVHSPVLDNESPPRPGSPTEIALDPEVANATSGSGEPSGSPSIAMFR